MASAYMLVGTAANVLGAERRIGHATPRKLRSVQLRDLAVMAINEKSALNYCFYAIARYGFNFAQLIDLVFDLTELSLLLAT
jgi:hypothetical protein